MEVHSTSKTRWTKDSQCRWARVWWRKCKCSQNSYLRSRARWSWSRGELTLPFSWVRTMPPTPHNSIPLSHLWTRQHPLCLHRLPYTKYLLPRHRTPKSRSWSSQAISGEQTCPRTKRCWKRTRKKFRATRPNSWSGRRGGTRLSRIHRRKQRRKAWLNNDPR